MPERLTRRQLQGEQSRRELLDVAKTLLAERGYAGVSVAQLSEAANLSTSSIYWHFGSKDGVLAAVVERGLKEFFETRPTADSYQGDPLERMEQMLAASARMLEQEPEYLRLLLLLTLEHHEGHEASLEVVDQMRALSLAHWEAALAPIFAPDGTPEQQARVHELALLGRAVSDGALIASLEDASVSMAAVYASFMRLVRALAADAVAPDAAP